MKLRAYKKEDASLICSSVHTEEELMQDHRIEYRFTAAEDIEDLMRLRLEMLRVVNGLDEDFVYDEELRLFGFR
ncbi:MAG: hypothetical protein J5829_06530 [Lachnospiraceae bacterium]|nr:hypothetical protein [Lachnospiraceae bacterium]